MEEKIRELLKEYEHRYANTQNPQYEEIYLHIINNLKQILENEERDNS